MDIKIAITISEAGTAIAEGTITRTMNDAEGNPPKSPVVRMRRLADAVLRQILEDSNET